MNKKKNLFSVLLVIFLFMHSFLSTSGIALAAEENGTESHPYLIKNATDLYNIPTDATSYYKLANDIDLENIKRVPLGPFRGVLDGGGHTISNLNITGATNAQNIALFSKLEDATIKNITFTNATVSASSSNTAIIAGNAFNSKFIDCSVTNSKITGNSNSGFLCGYLEIGTVSNCMTENTTLTAIGSTSIGSLIGSARRVTISNCKAVNPTITAGTYIGSIVGYIHEKSTIKNCSVNNPKIDSIYNYVGTICGRAENEINIINCNSMEGKISSTNVNNCYLGGLVGYAANIIGIKQCYTTTEVNATGQYSGGLIGYSDYSVTIEQCSAQNIVKGKTYVGGILGGIPDDARVKINITDSYHNGSITATDASGLAAGVVSTPLRTNSLIFKDGYIASYVTAKTIYAFAPTGTITESYFDSSLMGISNPAYNARPTSQMYKKNNYYTWDFKDMWSIDEGNDYPRLKLIIKEPEESILKVILEPSEKLKMSVDEDINENSKVEWTSSDTSIAEVDENGIVKAISRGDALITAKTSDGFYEEVIQVYVVDKASKYRLTLDLDVGEVCRLSIDNGKDLAAASWISNDISLATVSEIGRVKAIKNGLVLIVVKNGSGTVIGQVYIRVR